MKKYTITYAHADGSGRRLTFMWSKDDLSSAKVDSLVTVWLPCTENDTIFSDDVIRGKYSGYYISSILDYDDDLAARKLQLTVMSHFVGGWGK